MMKVHELIDQYLVHARGYYRKPRTRRRTSESGIIRVSTRPLRRVAGEMEVEDVTAATIAECRRWLIAQDTCCRKTINAYTARMVRTFTWGAEPEQGLVPELVALKLKALKPLAYGRSAARESEGLSAVERQRVNDLLASLLDPELSSQLNKPSVRLSRLRLATMIELQMETGLRPGELAAMTVESIDRSRDVWLYKPGEHKTEHREKKRVIPLLDNEQFLIRRWMGQAKVTTGSLFGIKRDSYRQAVLRALKRAKLDHWTPQQLRHTAGTEVRRDVGIDAAQALLGHSSVRTTEIYAENNLAEAIEQLRRHRYGS